MLDLIYTAVLFIGPGVALKCFENYMTMSERREVPRVTIYENLFRIVAISIIVSLLSAAAFNIYLYEKGIPIIATLTDLIEEMNRLGFLVKWIILDAAWLCVVKVVSLGGKKIVFFIANQVNKEDTGVESSSKDGKSVWENIFFNSQRTKEVYIAKIYVNGTFITAGIIQEWNSGYMPKREIEIQRSSEVDKIIKHDEKNPVNKWLSYVEFEYFDIETGLLIKFFDAEKALKHWDEL